MVLKKTLSIERLLLTAFALTLGVLLLVGAIALNVVSPFGQQVQSVDHTRQVMEGLQNASRLITRAESSQWGYLLTGEKQFVAERDAALVGTYQAIETVAVLTRDNEQQQVLMQRLKTAVDVRTGFLQRSQAVFEADGQRPAPGNIDNGRAATEAVLAIAQEAQDIEKSLLALRKQNEKTQLRIILGSIVLLLVALAFLALRLRRTDQSRQNDEKLTLVGRQEILRTGALQDAIFSSANFSSIATDAKGVIQIFNVGAERMLGYTAEEVVDKITPAGISDAQELVVRATALSVEAGTPITPGFEALVFKASRGIEDIYELTYIRKDGSRFPAIVSVTALRDVQENIIGYLLIGTDNTARKRVEAEQAVLDQRFRDQQFYTRSLIESNIDALMTTDPRGIISDVNQQMEVLTGCTRDELIGAPFKNFFTDPLRAQAGIDRVLREGKVSNYELTAHARTGVETLVSYNASTLYDRDRKLLGVFAAARDVTERQAFERQLELNNVKLATATATAEKATVVAEEATVTAEEATATAEKANRAKSEFLSSMSHELRTPLNAILGFAQLLESGSPAPTPTQKGNIAHILSGGWYLLDLINEILDLALIESGRLTLSPEPVALQGVLNECRAMIEPQAQKRGVALTLAEQKDSLYVLADRTRLKQVLINLLFNAVKYNREGGTVALDCEVTGAGLLRVSVCDTGQGLSGDQVEQLFQPFNRLGQETTAEEGTGIGLVVTKRLVELMGGSIGLKSTLGQGSTFWVELQLTEVPELVYMPTGETVADLLDAADGAPRYTLLYVEDNPANLNLVEQIIARRTDLRLLSAANAQLGIALARVHQPNVILMDINLPGMSGLEAMQLLRSDPLTAHIPILAVSANAAPGDIERGLGAGFFDYVTKPIRVARFMQSVNAALAHAASQKAQ